jgi:hypothetical protein
MYNRSPDGPYDSAWYGGVGASVSYGSYIDGVNTPETKKISYLSLVSLDLLGGYSWGLNPSTGLFLEWVPSYVAYYNNPTSAPGNDGLGRLVTQIISLIKFNFGVKFKF